MKRQSKLISVLLIGVMVIGMAFTAVAANGSPSVNPASQEKKVFYKNAKIAAGGGTISEITDEKTLASAYDQSLEVSKYVRNTLSSQFNKPVYIYETLLFDVNGVKSGQVTVQLGSEGKFDVNDAKGKLAVVSHFNSATGAWETQKDANGKDQLSEVDPKDGTVTFSFPSYSPIMISVLSASSSDLKDGNSLSVLKATMNPKQVLASASSTKSPKMGE